MKWIRIILFPIVPIYFLVTKVRNWLYDTGIKHSQSYNFPVICVGNLSVGGTGKTPVIEYLIRLLKEEVKLATLSRGYKRNTKGFVLADKNATPKSIGDEPFQFYNKFKNDINVAVDGNRQEGIQLLKELVNPDIILLDDAFQHRKVKAGLNILLTVFDKLYVDDMLLPTGDLREPISGAKRADIILVTKCPETLSDSEKDRIKNKLKLKENQHLFFSNIDYSPIVFGSQKEADLTLFKSKNTTIVTGIAKPQSFIGYLQSQGLVFEHLRFPDHHSFNLQEIANLETKDIILTTEKDYVRLKQYESIIDKLYYLPIQFKIDRAKEFDGIVKEFATN